MAEIVIKLVNGELAGKTAQQINKEFAAARLQVSKLEVGTKEWIKANERLDRAKQTMADYKAQVEATSKASGILKQQFGGILNQIPGFSQLSGALSAAKGGVGGLVSGFGVLKTAIAATGLGLLLIVIAALVSAFKNFTPLIDKVEQIFGGIRAVVQELTNRLTNLGAGLWKIITGAPGGLKQVQDSFDGLSNSIKKAYDAGVELAALQQDLDDRNRGIAISNAEAERSIERLIIQSKNRTLAEKERLSFLDQAEKKAREQFEKENKLTLDNLELSMKKARLKTKLSDDEIFQLAEGTLAQEIEYEKRGNLDDELLQEIADNRVKVINIEGRTNNLLEKINNQRDKLREAKEAKDAKAAEERQKREDEARKKREQDAQQELQALTNLANLRNERYLAGIKDAQLKELETIRLGTEEKIAALKGSEETIALQRAELQAMAEQQLQAVKDKYAAEAAAKDQKAKDDEMLRQSLAADKAIDLAQREADQKRLIKQAELEFTSGALGIAIQLLGEDEKARKKNAAAIKAFSIAKILVDLQQEIAGYMANPASTASLGVVGTLKTILAVARAGVAVRNVAAQKFELGGYLEGPRHSQGGIPIEAEGGEFIFSRAAVQGIGVANLARMNNMFAAGGPVNPFESARTAAASSAQTGGSQGMPVDFSPVVAEIRSLVAAMDRRIDRLEVINDLTKTKKGLQTLNELKSDADV